MKLLECEAKEIFEKYGILVPLGKIATTATDAYSIACEMASSVMLKAQIPYGGRGKAGGIKEANASQAYEIAKNLFEKRLITKQTPTKGILVKKILVQKKVEILKEFYLSIVLDREKECPVIIASQFGGVDIEEVPEKEIFKEYIDPLIGLQKWQARKIAFDLCAKNPQMSIALTMDIVSKLWKIFEKEDCSMVEINPLILATDEKMLALDAKMVIDDNALFRHPETSNLKLNSIDDSEETRIKEMGINYVKLDGNIGCIVNGAGLAMATMDAIKFFDGEPANFLDIGGGANPEKIKNAFKILFADKSINVIFVNIFGGIFRCDFLAEGLSMALEEQNLNISLVLRMEGNKADEGSKILNQKNIKFIPINGLSEGALKAVKLSREDKK